MESRIFVTGGSKGTDTGQDFATIAHDAASGEQRRRGAWWGGRRLRFQFAGRRGQFCVRTAVYSARNFAMIGPWSL